MTLAAGMACEGAKPVVAIYSTFLQRAYDQLIHDVALQNLDVLFAIDRGGVVGPDGATHAGSFDLSYLRCIPNMVVMAPADENECRKMLTTGFQHRRARPPCAIRAAAAPASPCERHSTTLPIGKAELRRRGARIALLAFGAMVPRGGAASPRRSALTLVNMRFVKPLDRALIARTGADARRLRHARGQRRRRRRRQRRRRIAGREGIALPMLHLGLPDAFQHHASREELLAEAGLDVAGIRASLLGALARPAAHAVEDGRRLIPPDSVRAGRGFPKMTARFCGPSILPASEPLTAERFHSRSPHPMPR